MVSSSSGGSEISEATNGYVPGPVTSIGWSKDGTTMPKLSVKKMVRGAMTLSLIAKETAGAMWVEPKAKYLPGLAVSSRSRVIGSRSFGVSSRW